MKYIFGSWILVAFWTICLIGCKSAKVVKDVTTSVRTDSVFTSSDRHRETASVLSIHDTIRIHDSIRIVVDSIGKVIQEVVWHNQTERIIEHGKDTVIIIQVDSTNVASSSEKKSSHTENKIVEKTPFKVYVFLFALLLIILGIIYIDTKRYKNGRGIDD